MIYKPFNLTLGYLQSILDYDPETGIFRWKVQRNQNARPGSVAGRTDSHGHIQITVDGTAYGAHRLAWFMMTGELPPLDIDHENRNRSDNRFVNLREATRRQNVHNQPARRTSQTGIKGVYPHKQSGKYAASLKRTGRPRHIGFFDTVEEAAEAVRFEILREHGAFANTEVGE